MSRIACKFGGTSVADAGQIRKVREILLKNPKRTVVVPSAPGKRVSSEAKITDLLYLCHEMATMGTDFSGPFELIRSRFLEIERDLGVQTALSPALEQFRAELSAGCSKDHAASRGEFFNGLIMATFLGAEFVDPRDFIVLGANGRIDPQTYQLLGARMADTSRMYVMPGFYGRDASGQVKTFSRGGSDISGAIAARAAQAELYENWTDVSGLLMADPRVVSNPRPMAEVTYREIRELSYMGASVFHDEAILPVREAGIPINIKNTNLPDHPGTLIVHQLSQEEDKSTEIAGVAGKKGFSMIAVEKSLMNKEVGFAYRLLGILERRGINVEHCPSGIDGMNVIVETSQLGDSAEDVLEEIRRVLQPDNVTIEKNLALIAVVGEGMIRSVGIAAKLFQALRDSGVNVKVINQGASELNIIVGVSPDDYEKAVRAIYSAFIC